MLGASHKGKRHELTGAVEAGNSAQMSMKPLIRRMANTALALPWLRSAARALGRSGLLPS
jgi:hypothetical protein